MKTIKTLIISTSLAKWKRRLVSMALFISILLGVAAPAAGTFGPEGQQPDPFAEMVDAFTDPYIAAREQESTDRRMLDSHLRELDPNAGKSDRYIVKYKEGRAASFASKTSSLIAETAGILTAEIDTLTGAFGRGGSGERAPVTIPAADGAQTAT